MMLYQLFLFVPACDNADIIFILDSSGSINDADPGNWVRVLTFVKDVVAKFGAGGGNIRFALVRFSDVANVEFVLDAYSDPNELYARIDKVAYYGGRTNIAHGFEVALSDVVGKNGDRPDAPNIVILITDGIPNEREGDTIPQATLMKRVARVLSVGITNAVDMDLLRAIASDQFTDVVTASDFARLTEIVEGLVGAACPTPTPRPTPTPIPCKYQNKMYSHISNLILFILSFVTIATKGILEK